MPTEPLPVYAVVPFAAMLLAIAVCPLWIPHWWESNRNKLVLACALGLPVVGLYAGRHPHALLETAEEYVSFMLLLTALYVIAGGIRLTGDLRATPLVNTTFLATGSVLASFLGTTGASMLLIRPVLQTNRQRTQVTHTVVFFIFLVANIGGLLTPLGDPPLFLGYLEGVPFTWTFRLLPHWLFTVAILLLAYFVWDSVAYGREPAQAVVRDIAQRQPLRIAGTLNFVWLAGRAARRGVPPRSLAGGADPGSRRDSRSGRRRGRCATPTSSRPTRWSRSPSSSSGSSSR